MREKVIVVGVGNEYKEIKKDIEEIFEIIYLADNLQKGKELDGFMCISLEETIEKDFDKVIICSSKYEDLFKEQLFTIGISPLKVYVISDIKRILLCKQDINKYQSDSNKYICMYNEGNNKRFKYLDDERYPKISDWHEEAGVVDSHYFYMDIMIAKEIIKRKPQKHYDVGSRIDGFISHLIVSDIDTTIIDIRPLSSCMSPGCGIKEVKFIQSDATDLGNIADNSIESLSALHSVEHFGLGRYGDNVDPEACFKAMNSLARVLKVGGILYFAVPVGKKEKLCFNAHRIFEPYSVVDDFSNLRLEKMYLLHNMKFYEFSLANLMERKYNEVIGEFDCGLYIFSK